MPWTRVLVLKVLVKVLDPALMYHGYVTCNSVAYMSNEHYHANAAMMEVLFV